MSDASAEWEGVLCAAFAEEADCYARAARLATELAAACGRGEPIDDRLRQVLGLLDEIAVHEERIAPAKRCWEQAGRPVGRELRNLMEQIAGLIRQLGGELQTIEQAARVRRDELAVELDVCNRRRQMQRVYRGKS